MSGVEKACAESELLNERPKVCTVGGKPVVVVRTGGATYAVDGTCPHRGGPLAEGFVADGCIICPWHGWAFDLRTGQTAGGAGGGLRTYPVAVDGGIVRIQV